MRHIWSIHTLVARTGRSASFDDLIPIECAPVFRRSLEAIEGAIILSVDGRSIMDASVGDDVDTLWAYIVNMLETVVTKNTDDECSYPSQPIPLGMQLIGRDRIQMFAGDAVTVPLPRTYFLTFMLEQAQFAFMQFLRIYPQSGDSYKSCIQTTKFLLERVRSVD